MVDEEPLDKTLQRVATLACLSLDACDLSSITLEAQTVRTAACTDEAARKIDEAQYAADDGPCLHAYRKQEVTEVPSIPDEDRWPAFAERAREHGVLSSLSIRLVLPGDGRGAVNLYARRPASFTAEDRKHAKLFAEQAA